VKDEEDEDGENEDIILDEDNSNGSINKDCMILDWLV